MKTTIRLISCLILASVLLSLHAQPPVHDLPDIDIELPQFGVRNVLLIVADDMGIDLSRQYLAINGNAIGDLPATPTIRRLRRSGIAFDNAWANPVCSPTRAGILTGRHAFRTTVTDAVPVGPGLPANEETLPELLNSQTNYMSGLFGKWHLGGGTTGPIDQGFDEHRGIIGGALDYSSWTKVENGVEVDGNPATPAMDPTTAYPTQENIDDAIDWISTQTTPWFAMIAFNTPHTPLHAPNANCDGVDLLAAADINLMIECLDDQVDRLLTELENMGELSSTTIIFIGDNGTESASLMGPFDTSPNDSFKGNVYEGGIRAPFIVSDGYHLLNGTQAPISSGVGRIISPGRREDAPVHTVDIFATIATITGVSASPEDSRSLIPYFTSATATDQREYNYTERCSGNTGLYQAAIRNDSYKLIYRLDFNVLPLSPEIELYEVADIEEANDLYCTEPGAVNELLTELIRMWDGEGFDPLGGSCP